MVVTDNIEERIVNGGLNNNIIALFGKCSYSVCKGKNNARGLDKPLLFIGEAETLFKPGGNNFVVVVLCVAVAENAAVKALL